MRLGTLAVFANEQDFNPRTREGCDVNAVTGGVFGGYNFNPRTREGCDVNAVTGGVFGGYNFNPRTREGCDPYKERKRQQYHNFNPRTREGCDDNMLAPESLLDYISIHAPVKGATMMIYG